ncbi:MAG: hypothetical protein R8M38_02635 [Mariprofundaceae bacterium]
MELNQFVIAATQIGTVEVSDEASGWSICFKDRASGQKLPCTCRSGEARHWKNVDTLIKQLRRVGYRGRLIIPVSAEQSLFG